MPKPCNGKKHPHCFSNGPLLSLHDALLQRFWARSLTKRKVMKGLERCLEISIYTHTFLNIQPIPFSRMRSEGFPFIVGVWGWTCVRVVLLCRRRVVVVSSSCRRRVVVNSLPLGGTFALRHTSYFQSMKSGGSLARNALFGAPKSQNVRSFSCFA